MRKKRALTIIGLVALLLLGLISGGMRQASTHRRMLVAALTRQLDEHSLRISDILAEMRHSNVSLIEDAAYYELQTMPSSSLIERSMVKVGHGHDGALQCAVDTSKYGIAPYLIRRASSKKAATNPSAEELDQAFAILETLLTNYRSDQDAGRIFIPSFGGVDFPQDFIDRLSKDHPRVMTREHLNTLPIEAEYFRVIDGKGFLPESYKIRWIRPTGAMTAVAFVYTGTIGGAADHQILLQRVSGRWTVTEDECVVFYD